jgi:hypothetical protein
MSHRDSRNRAAIVPTQIAELERFGDVLQVTPDEDEVEECDAVLGSCSFCLTDFTTTIRLRKKNKRCPEREPTDVIVVSYHHLGACRSPLDWEWQTFCTKMFPYPPTNWSTRGQRLGHGFEEGTIRRRWNEAEGRMQRI